MVSRGRYFTTALFLIIVIHEGSSSLGGSRYTRNILRKRESEGSNSVVMMDEEGKHHGGFNRDCSDSTRLTKERPTYAIEPEEDIFKQPRARCHWNIIGSGDCIPTLMCKKFKLAPNPPNSTEPCPEEYLEVTDGLSGYQKFCGTEGPKSMTTSHGLRDLYITLIAGKEAKSGRGFKCLVSCAAETTKAAAASLEDNFEGEKNEFCTCGRKPNENRIVGGESAHRGEFPWIVGLVTANTRKPYCGGTVINDRFILTAAHCFKGPYQNVKNFQILINGRVLELTTTEGTAGTGNVATPLTAAELKNLQDRDAADDAVRFDVDEYWIHPLYVKQTNDYDISLIKLKKPIDFKKYSFIQPVCLPKLHVYNNTFENDVAIVAGWGLNAANASSTMSTLQRLNITVFTHKECRGFYAERMSPRMLCAGYREGLKDACKGDSGGPLISLKSASVWQLIGAVSWGEGCAEKNLPGVYTRITEVNQWVRYISNVGEAVWCRGKD